MVADPLSGRLGVVPSLLTVNEADGCLTWSVRVVFTDWRKRKSHDRDLTSNRMISEHLPGPVHFHVL